MAAMTTLERSSPEAISLLSDDEKLTMNNLDKWIVVDEVDIVGSMLSHKFKKLPPHIQTLIRDETGFCGKDMGSLDSNFKTKNFIRHHFREQFPLPSSKK